MGNRNETDCVNETWQSLTVSRLSLGSKNEIETNWNWSESVMNWWKNEILFFDPCP